MYVKFKLYRNTRHTRRTTANGNVLFVYAQFKFYYKQISAIN